MDEAETRWVTYAELAEARGIDKASAIRLTLRRKWQRQKDNRGIVRVMVPADDLRPSGDAPNGISADMSHEPSIDTERLVGALEARIVALEAEVIRERERADEERKRADLVTSEVHPFQGLPRPEPDGARVGKFHEFRHWRCTLDASSMHRHTRLLRALEEILHPTWVKQPSS